MVYFCQFLTLKHLYIDKNNMNIMKKKIDKKKITFSISLDPELLILVNENISNRSKFIEICIISELCKNEDIKSELKNNHIIL
jgi:hypothetical protein